MQKALNVAILSTRCGLYRQRKKKRFVHTHSDRLSIWSATKRFSFNHADRDGSLDSIVQQLN